MSEKKSLLAALLRNDLASGNHAFQEILRNLAIQKLGKQPIDADRFAAQNIRKYWNWLLALIDEHKGRGLSPYFVVPNRSSYAIACASQELTTAHDAESQWMGRRLRNRGALLRQLDLLDDRLFEALAGVVCEAIGADRFLLTPAGNEGGVDFFAHIHVRNPSSIFPVLGTQLRIVGQCKKYAAALAVDKFEQFLQTMNNVRYRSDRVRNHVPAWFNESSAPIVGWMISHSGFQTGASDEGKQHGVYMSDSLDLAEILCPRLPDVICDGTFLADRCKNYL